MKNNDSLRQQIACMRQSFFDERILDDKFVELEGLESEDNPDFVEDVFGLFFRDSTRDIASIEESLQQTPINAFMVEKMLYRLKGSSGSIGAAKIKREVDQMTAYCREGNTESAKAAFQLLKSEHANLKAKIEPYLELLGQAKLDEPDAPATKQRNCINAK